MFDALAYALAELDDPLVNDLALVSVLPAPGAARMLVILTAPRDHVDLDAALARLHGHAHELREEVAAEISRRRVPELVFRIELPADS